jgi:hypothetical protein
MPDSFSPPTSSFPYPGPNGGGAYIVLFERVSPIECNTPEREKEINEEFQIILTWASNLEDHSTFLGYQWAVDIMRKEIRERVNQARKARETAAAYQTIAKPPGKE